MGGRVVSGQNQSISLLRLRWMIMSCTEPMVILRRLVSVALVKWPYISFAGFRFNARNLSMKYLLASFQSDGSP